MTKHLLVVALLIGCVASPPGLAQTESERAENAGQAWYDRMASALRELNFEATLVKTHGQRIQPMLWMHGLHQDGLEVELLMQLNGTDVRVLRLGDQTSYYFQPSDNSYSLETDVTFGLLPAAFYKPFSELNEHYQVVASGGMRVTGRPAQYLRLVSRDNNRYHYDLWIDRDTGMLLKLQMMTPQGEILEQLQLTTLQLFAELPVSLDHLKGAQRPPKLYDKQKLQALQFGFEPQWLPQGFKLLRKHHRSLYHMGIPTDYYLYSDGLTEVSIYIANDNEQKLPDLALQGPESLYNTQQRGYVITVVGKLPVETLRRIGENMEVPRQSGR